jgi:hypothetical protein
MLFAAVAGAIGDLVDRRRFLLISQWLMLAAAAPFRQNGRVRLFRGRLPGRTGLAWKERGQI